MRYFLTVLTIALFFMTPINMSAAEPTARLNIPNDRQDKALSCEAASLKMALRFKGVDPLTEDQLMAIIGYNEPLKRQKGVWGDPDVAFVGNIRGRQNTTGYGVHWTPIAKAAQVFRPESQEFTGWSASQLASEIAAGNPIIIWGLYGRSWKDPWKTPEGKVVNAWRGEHTRVIIGFTGDPANPQSFILNDPLINRPITWSTSQLMKNSAPFGTAGVVVR